MGAAGFVCCFLVLQEEKLGNGKPRSLWEALALFVLACKDLGRFPKGSKVFFFFVSRELLFASVSRVLSVGF